MSGDKELILELFKDGKELSTSEVVNAVYSDLLSDDASLETKSKLHRKLIYHLNKLVEDRVLRVSGYKSKGEKIFRAARDLVVQLPHNKVVISNKVHSLKGLEMENDSVFEYSPFGIMVNSLLVNAKSLNLSQLNSLLKDLYKEVNDVIAIHNIEYLLATSNVEELNHFFTSINALLKDRKLSLLIKFNNPNAHYLGKVYNSLKNKENIEIVLILNDEDFLSKNKELAHAVEGIIDAGLKINISEDNTISFPGNAGTYSTIIKEELITVVSTNSVCVDFSKIKALPAIKIKELLMRIAKGMHQVNSHQQLDSEELFPIIKSYGGKISLGVNSLRFWNYDWKTDDYLMELLEELKEELAIFALNQERIYVSAGMPINFKIALGTAFNSFNRERLSARDYEKGVVYNFSDLTNTYAEYIKMRNKNFSLFDKGDRLRIFRQKTNSKDLLKEFHHLMTQKIPYLTYDFRSLTKEINLRDFM